MTKKISILLIALLLVIINIIPIYAVTNSGINNNAEKIKVGFFLFSGFNEKSEDDKLSGYGYEYLNEISKYTGWEYEFVFGTWDECLNMLEKGEIDILGSAQKTEEREKIFDYPKLESGISYAILSIKEKNVKIAYEDYFAFNGMTVGLMEGNSRNKRFEEYCLENNVTVNLKMYENEKKLVSALHDDSVDAIVTSNLRKGKGERIVAKFAPSPFYFAVTKGNKKILDEINYAQSQIKVANPYYDIELFDKYYSNGNDLVPVFTKEEIDFIRRSPTLKVSYKENAEPIEFKDKKTGRFSGINADIINIIENNSGLKFEYVPMVSKSMEKQALQSGNVDIISGFENDFQFYSDDIVTISNPYISIPCVMITSTKLSEKEKEKRTIALVMDDESSIQAATKWSPKSKHIYYDDLNQCFKAIIDGDADLTFSNTYVAGRVMNSYDSNKFNITTMSNNKNEICLGISKKFDPILLSIINKSIQNISNEKQDEIIISNTIVLSKPTMGEFMRENTFVIIGIILFIFFIILSLLVYIMFIKYRNRKKVDNLLYKDSLTGAWNLNKFRQDVDIILKSEEKTKYLIACLDIEKFKSINEKYGYEEADNLLNCITDILEKQIYKETEKFARISADNFIILIKEIDKMEIFNRIIKIIRSMEEIKIKEFEDYKIKVDIGICNIEKEDFNVSAIIDRASEAKKTIKGIHNKNYAFYDDAIKENIEKIKTIENEMVFALKNGEYNPYYQVKVNLKTRKIVGAEALARWIHPERGIISPFKFIPVFEKNGFITELDFEIYEQLCKNMKEWIDSGKEVFPISCNFSRIHLKNPEFVKRLEEIAKKYNVDHSLLEIELTESVAEESSIEMINVCATLRKKGFSIALDDFGTGYSSLTLLNKLPINTLKLDKEFLKKGFFNENEGVLMDGFISIAHKLNMSVVCEGVESVEQEAFLNKINCEIGQGYVFSKPVSKEEFERFSWDNRGLVNTL